MSFVNNSFLFSFEIECRIERSFFFYIGHCLHVSDSVHNFKIWHFFRLKRETYQMITLYVCSVECFSNVLCKQQFFCFCLKLNGRSSKGFFFILHLLLFTCFWQYPQFHPCPTWIDATELFKQLPTVDRLLALKHGNLVWIRWTNSKIDQP